MALLFVALSGTCTTRVGAIECLGTLPLIRSDVRLFRSTRRKGYGASNSIFALNFSQTWSLTQRADAVSRLACSSPGRWNTEEKGASHPVDSLSLPKDEIIANLRLTDDTDVSARVTEGTRRGSVRNLSRGFKPNQSRNQNRPPSGTQSVMCSGRRTWIGLSQTFVNDRATTLRSTTTTSNVH